MANQYQERETSIPVYILTVFVVSRVLIFIRRFAENLVGLGLLQSVSNINSIPTHEKKRNERLICHLDVFLGLGCPWTGELVS